jgi:very-short-patch-repair endonuclease
VEPVGKTTGRIRGTTRGLEAGARELRNNPTPAERRLWEALKGRQVAGLRFRQQHPVGPFVLDFYCPSAKLVVEVDGGVHDEQRDQDAYRDDHLASYGYRVLRFRNDEVMDDLPLILARIAAAAVSPDQSASIDAGRLNPRPLRPRS